MKRILQYLGGLLLTIFITATLFFFWASSPNYAKTAYSKLTTNTYDQEIDSDSIYSIVTYNIGYLSGMTNNKAIEKPRSLYEANLTKVKEAFTLLKPDIIAFQEIDFASARSFHINQQDEIASLGYNYVAQTINWDETYVPFPYWPPSLHFGEMLSGQSILSKHPLSDHRRIVLERVKDNPFYRDALYLERLAQIATVKLDEKELVIINIHLEAFDQSTRKNQMNTIIDIFKKYAKDKPTILLGDFNSLAREPDAAIHQIFALPAIGNAGFDKNNPANTYDTRNPFKRIDYIFYTEDTIEYIDGKTLPQFGQASDHLPVVMRFKLK